MAVINMVATMKTTISRVYPASACWSDLGLAEGIPLILTGRTGFLQSQCGPASGRNLLHIRGRIRQPNDTESAHECIAFTGDDDVLVIGGREECAPVIPAEITDVAEVFGIHRQGWRPWRRSRGGNWLRGRRRRRRRRKRRAKNAAVNALVFQGKEAFQDIQSQRRIIHVERGKSSVRGNLLRSVLFGRNTCPVRIDH